ncbi:MAG: hypothetical protein D6812_04005 [Deltaproteobacteria bacterium]|nr:MAG: hypothetical protein D6812_04005 [Deltaproteobacteria bacterium]
MGEFTGLSFRRIRAILNRRFPIEVAPPSVSFRWTDGGIRSGGKFSVMEDSLFYTLMGLLQLALAFMGGLHAMLYKRSPRSAALWLVICFFVPFLGPLAYAVLGVNRTQRRAAQRKLRSGLGSAVALEREPPVGLPGPFHSLFRLTNRISEFPLTEGNQIEPLYDGDEAFPRMIEAIDGARQSVTCCSYIFDNDTVGHRFIEAFGRAVKRGVRVHLLIDGVAG